MPTNAHPNGPVRFGSFELDAAGEQLRKDGKPLHLQPQPFRVLSLLTDRAGQLVSREELQHHLWNGDTFVDFEQGLNVCIRQIRAVLNDNADHPRFIETVPRRGYRFIAAIEERDLSRQSASPTPITSAASLPQEEAVAASSVVARRFRRRRVAVAGIMFAVLSLGLTLLFIRQRVPSLKVVRNVRITNDGRDKSGNISDGIPSPIVTDGTRLYFVEPKGGYSAVAQVSAAGGDTVSLPAPFQSVRLTDISPDRMHLLVGNTDSATPTEVPFYSLPTLGGSAHRLGNFLAHDAAWSPNGVALAYANGDSLYVTSLDGTSARKIVEGKGTVWWPRWSHDGTRLRFTAEDLKAHSTTLWEIRADGTGLHNLTRDWNLAGDMCCGTWTPDGKYFIFQVIQDESTTLWAVRDDKPLFGRSQPVQLTFGPLWTSAPAVGLDGKQMFAIGVQPRIQPIRYDRGNKQFVSILPGISADGLDFTRDGNWVTYTQYPERTLWRARSDGTQRLQLTSGPLRAVLPRWSPDGSHIAFFGLFPQRPWKLYLLSADGGTPEQLISGNANEGDPSWSPDSQKLAFGRLPWIAGAPEKPLIQIIDLPSRRVSVVPGSEGMFSPRWSPNGRYILATTADSSKFTLYDFNAQKWLQLAEGMFAYPNWSHDGQYVYAIDVKHATVIRIQIGTGRIEPIVDLNSERLAWTFGSWAGLAPDDSILAVRDMSTQEIYALELSAEH